MKPADRHDLQPFLRYDSKIHNHDTILTNAQHLSLPRSHYPIEPITQLITSL